MGAFFAFVAVFPLFSGNPLRLWTLTLSLAFAGPAVIAPSLLAPLNRLWFQCGLLLHKVVSPIVLIALYYLILTPLSLWMRWFTKDPLKMNWNAASDSYWVDREPPRPESMANQF